MCGVVLIVLLGGSSENWRHLDRDLRQLLLICAICLCSLSKLAKVDLFVHFQLVVAYFSCGALYAVDQDQSPAVVPYRMLDHVLT